MTLLGASGRVLADSDTGKGSPIGLFVVLVLIVAVYFLYRSMSRHIKRVPDSFDGPQDAAGPDPSAQPRTAASPTDTAPQTGPAAGAGGRRGEPTG